MYNNITLAEEPIVLYIYISLKFPISNRGEQTKATKDSCRAFSFIVTNNCSDPHCFSSLNHCLNHVTILDMHTSHAVSSSYL